MRKHGRTDANHSEIVAALRQAGASVQSLASIGDGCADLLVGFRGKNYALEIKTSLGKITPDEMKWLNEWSGHAQVVRSADEALKAIGAA